MAKVDEIKYLERLILKLQDSIESSFLDHYFREGDDDYPAEHSEYIENVLAKNIFLLYQHICLYFEIKDLKEYLVMFNETVKARIFNRKEILHNGYLASSSDDDDPVIYVVDSMTDFLLPFEFFRQSAIEKESSTQLEKLTQLLKSTNVILNKTKTSVTNEASIYNQVKWVLDLYYPSISKPSSSFISHFKEYRADILIPAIYTAIEFKLISKKGNIDNYLDQIIVDANSYKGDEKYKRFVAVLCLKNAIANEAHIREAWKGKGFPRNWEYVVVFLGT